MCIARLSPFILFIWLAVSPYLNGSQRELLLAAKEKVARHDWTAALKLFNEAVRIDPDNGEIHYYLGQLHALQGSEETAVIHFLKALELLPEEELVWSEYGRWLLRFSYFLEAERVYRHLVRSRSPEPDYWIGLGRAQYENGNPVAALQSYETRLQMPGAQAGDYYLAALAARSLARLDNARQYLLRGLSLDPNHQEINYQMADLLLHTAQPSESLPYWTRLNPDHVRGLFGQAMAWISMRQTEKAVPLLEKVLKLEPAHTQAHYQLAMILSRQGKEQQSRHHFEQFRRLEREDREGSRIQERKEIVKRP